MSKTKWIIILIVVVALLIGAILYGGYIINAIFEIPRRVLQ